MDGIESLSWDKLAPKFMEFGKDLLICVLILVIGFWLIGKLTKLMTKLMEKKNMDPTVRGFLRNLIGTTLKVLVILTAAQTVGIETTSFIALLGVAGLAVGMALQGTLGNFAGGVMILIFKPFRIGDTIEFGGNMGVVKNIQIFNTILITADNKKVIIPNGGLSTGTVINHNTADSN